MSDRSSGKDHGVARDGVYPLGWVAGCELPGLLDLADAFVQPGQRDAFNIYRLPSKLPEFLAMGRPVVVPPANIGQELSEAGAAMTTTRGDSEEIAACVEALMDDPDLQSQLGLAARAFAERRLDWSAKARALNAFYATLLPSQLAP
jgi:glycosyltransferase involved in cell wall biosynthesis